MSLQGRRVEAMSDLEHPGDYTVIYQQRRDHSTAIAALWFILPCDQEGRIAAKGFGQPQTHTGQTEPEWEITEDQNGVVTVEPSIDYPDHWHGHLRAGVWTGA